MGAALLGGTAFAQADGPQGPGPNDEGQRMRPPCEGQERGQAGMQHGRPDQERGPGMLRERRAEGMGAPQMQRGGPGPQGGHDRMPNPEQLKKAGATEQQLEALKTFGYEQKIKRIDLQAAAKKAELALDQLMTATTVDEKAAMKAADALTQARGELFKLEISARVKAQQILGEELLKKLHDQKPPEGREGRGPRPEGPQGKDAPPASDRPQPQGQK